MPEVKRLGVNLTPGPVNELTGSRKVVAVCNSCNWYASYMTLEAVEGAAHNHLLWGHPEVPPEARLDEIIRRKRATRLLNGAQRMCIEREGDEFDEVWDRGYEAGAREALSMLSPKPQGSRNHLLDAFPVGTVFDERCIEIYNQMTDSLNHLEEED